MARHGRPAVEAPTVHWFAGVLSSLPRLLCVDKPNRIGPCMRTDTMEGPGVCLRQLHGEAGALQSLRGVHCIVRISCNIVTTVVTWLQRLAGARSCSGRRRTTTRRRSLTPWRLPGIACSPQGTARRAPRFMTALQQVWLSASVDCCLGPAVAATTKTRTRRTAWCLGHICISQTLCLCRCRDNPGLFRQVPDTHHALRGCAALGRDQLDAGFQRHRREQPQRIGRAEQAV